MWKEERSLPPSLLSFSSLSPTLFSFSIQHSLCTQSNVLSFGCRAEKSRSPPPEAHTHRTEKPEVQSSDFLHIGISRGRPGRGRGNAACLVPSARPLSGSCIPWFWPQVRARCVCVSERAELCGEALFLCRFCRRNILAHPAHLLQSPCYLEQLVF